MSINTNFPGISEGMVLSGCRIIAKIGEGGMGSVYRAIDENLERIVAIKVMRQQPGHDDLRERFRREAKSVAKLINPGIAQVYTAGEYKDYLYYIMEFVDGASLDSFLKKASLITCRKHNIDELILAGYIKEPDMTAPYFLRDLTSSPILNPCHLDHVNNLVTSVAETLFAVHESGAVHRDIKPSNIIVSKKDEVKLVDFGLVKRSIDAEITQMNQFVGTLNYMAPEQFMGKKGKITPATDIYSLGVVYYELATLVKPVEEEELASLINAVTSGKIEDPRKYNNLISPQLSAIIQKCLSKDPGGRYKNAKELACAIKNTGKNIPLFTNIKNFFNGFFGSAAGRAESDYVSYGPAISHSGPSNMPSPGLESSSESTVSSAARKDKNASNASDSAADASRALYEEAREEYFTEFVNDNVKDKLEQSLDLNPLNVPAFLLCYVLVNHGMIERSKFDGRWKFFEPYMASASESEKMILGIIEAAHFKNDLKTASSLSIRYHHLHPGDLVMIILMCCIESELSNFQRMLEYCDKIALKYPDFVTTQLFAADIHAGLGDLDKCMAILKKVGEKYPENKGRRLVAVQNLLSAGRLDEVEEFMNGMISTEPADNLLVFLKPKLNIYRGKIKEAVTELRKSIGLTENPVSKAYHYYMLYRIHLQAGENEKAGEYLKMANKLSPENNFKSFEEMKNEIDSLTFTGFAPENIKHSHFEAALKHAREICLKTLNPLSYFKFSTLATTTYYHVDGSAGCEKVVVYSSFRYITDTINRDQAYLDSAPISPFVDYKGNILDTTCRSCPTPFGNFLAVINYASPQRGGDPMFLMAQFEPMTLNFNRDDKDGGPAVMTLKTSEMASWNALYHGIVVSFPTEFKVRSVSPAPDKIVETEERKFYLYSKFLFAGERFPVEATFEI